MNLDRPIGALDRLLPPSLRAAESGQRVRARFLLWFGLLLVLGSVGMVVVGAPSEPGLVGLAVIESLGMLLGLGMLWRGWSLDAVASLYAGLILAGTAAFALTAESAARLMTMWWLIPTLLTTYLVSLRVGIRWALASAALATAVFVARQAGFEAAFTMGPALDSPSNLLANFIALALVVVLEMLHGAMRREADTEIHRSEARLARLVDGTDAMICSLDPAGRFTGFNERFGRYFEGGTGEYPTVGAAFLRLVDPEQRAAWEERIARALEGEPVRETASIRHQGGHYYADIAVLPVCEDDEGVTGVTVVARDVTDQVETEQARTEAERRVRELAARMGRAETAASILHNVGNVLNSVNVSSQQMKERLQSMRAARVEQVGALLSEHAEDLPAFFASDPRAARIPEYLARVGRQLAGERNDLVRIAEGLDGGMQHLREIVSAQQELSRRAGQVEQADVVEMVEAALTFKASSFARRDAVLRRDFADLPPAWIDRHQALQVLINLLENAAQAVEGVAEPAVTVAIRELRDDRFRIEVRDNGCGIDPAHQDQLLDLGFTTKDRGSGFGLHFSAAAARQMGGELGFTSEGQGRGATFWIDLPFAQSTTAASRVAASGG